MAKIGATLEYVLRGRESAGLDDEGQQIQDEAEKELKDLRSLAKNARKFYRYVHSYSDPIDENDTPMRNALTRVFGKDPL